MNQTSSRADFEATLATDAAAGKKALLLGPLGAGKTHTLLRLCETLQRERTPFVFIDLFTAASTPERLFSILADVLSPFMTTERTTIATLSDECALDRHNASSCLLRLLDLVATRPASEPFIWLIDEVTEIRSLAYFPDLGHVEVPFTRALTAGRGAILTSSYPDLAASLFPGLDQVDLPGLDAGDLDAVASLRSDGSSVATAIAFTQGRAATLLPLLADMKDTRDTGRSLVRLLRPGGMLELECRRHYEVLLMRSRGYAVCKRAAEVVAQGRDQRLTDLFPLIGRTAGASRQYLHWLVEVGLLIQVRKRYDFADPTLGLWASLYLGRGSHPTRDEIETAVAGALTSRGAIDEPEDQVEAQSPPPRRADRFEEID